MPPLRRALLAREALILSSKGSLAFGPAEARVRKILALAGVFGMFSISLALLISRLRAVGVVPPPETLPSTIFVGIGSLREFQLVEHISELTRLEPIVIDQRNLEGFSKLLSPRLGAVLRQWFGIMREARSILGEPVPVFQKLDLLSTFTIRSHELAYLLAWFKELRVQHPNIRIVCSTADLPAHAASIAGFLTEYHQHGLLASSLIFPDFSKMAALTIAEGKYVAERVPGLELELKSEPSLVRPMNRTLALAGDYGATDPEPVSKLVKTALSNGYRVVVRPHPRGDDRLWSGISEHEDVTFENDGSFEEFLQKWRPSFVASWFSTTLIDGLMAGALPITLSVGKTDLVLPLQRIALQFPKEISQVQACMEDVDIRERAWNSSYSVVME